MVISFAFNILKTKMKIIYLMHKEKANVKDRLKFLLSYNLLKLLFKKSSWPSSMWGIVESHNLGLTGYQVKKWIWTKRSDDPEIKPNNERRLVSNYQLSFIKPRALWKIVDHSEKYKNNFCWEAIRSSMIYIYIYIYIMIVFL